MFWLRVSSITKLDFRPGPGCEGNAPSSQKHQKKSSPLVSDSHGTLPVSRLAFLSGGLLSLDSRMESYHEIETDNGLASQSVPRSVPLSLASHSTFAGFTPSRISNHELDLKLEIF